MKLGASALHRLPEDGGYGYLGMGGLEVRREGYSFPIQYGLSFEELIYPSPDLGERHPGPRPCEK